VLAGASPGQLPVFPFHPEKPSPFSPKNLVRVTLDLVAPERFVKHVRKPGVEGARQPFRAAPPKISPAAPPDPFADFLFVSVVDHGEKMVIASGSMMARCVQPLSSECVADVLFWRASRNTTADVREMTSTEGYPRIFSPASPLRTR